MIMRSEDQPRSLPRRDLAAPVASTESAALNLQLFKVDFRSVRRPKTKAATLVSLPHMLCSEDQPRSLARRRRSLACRT